MIRLPIIGVGGLLLVGFGAGGALQIHLERGANLAIQRQNLARSDCHPNYDHRACVPIASDVDCFGGSGNGPAYVRGPVRVIGRDIYRLDGDGDGIGCE